MIVPSIDIIKGRAVQLRQGRELVLDGGDPLERLEELSRVGEVAVIDLDAALGQGDNRRLIEAMLRRGPCRVGGGIRDLDLARHYLDAGARSVIIGTRATPEFCAGLPRQRVIAAVDARHGEVVDQGWRRATGVPVLEAIERLAPHVGGFLLTQVEREGEMAGFDEKLIAEAHRRVGDARLTVAGGITAAAEIAAFDRDGIDAQVGMALYSGTLRLADVLIELLGGEATAPWPSVVCERSGRSLGLVWSRPESLRAALGEGRGIYWSRSRQALWRKGETSGCTQRLLGVELDCDRDALRFAVEQHGRGFCHSGSRDCWGDRFDAGTLERTVASRLRDAPPESGTARLARTPALLRSKLIEEAGELADADERDHCVEEAADLIYFATVALSQRGADWSDVWDVLARRHLRTTRRPMQAKPGVRG